MTASRSPLFYLLTFLEIHLHQLAIDAALYADRVVSGDRSQAGKVVRHITALCGCDRHRNHLRTFARAEFGLGSPAQPAPTTHSKTVSSAKAFPSAEDRRVSLTCGQSEAELRPGCAASGLPEAVVIRGPLSKTVV